MQAWLGRKGRWHVKERKNPLCFKNNQAVIFHFPFFFKKKREEKMDSPEHESPDYHRDIFLLHTMSGTIQVTSSNLCVLSYLSAKAESHDRLRRVILKAEATLHLLSAAELVVWADSEAKRFMAISNGQPANSCIKQWPESTHGGFIPYLDQ